MADLTQLEAALVKADAAGDADAVRVLAGEVRKARSVGKDYKALSTPEPVDPTSGMGTGQLLAAGAGRALSDIGRGIRQRFGLTEPGEVEAARAQDAPLMARRAGQVGNFAGAMGAALPAMLIPGVNTAVGATALGAAMGAAQPTAEGESVLLNTGLGAAGGAAGKYLGDKITGAFANRAAAQQAAGATAAAQNAPRDAVLTAAREAGYVVPGSQVAPASATNRVVESVGGKAATAQLASERNQVVTNNLTRKALGLAEDAPLTEAALEGIRKTAGQAYEAIKTLPGRFQADTAFRRDVAALGSDFAKAAKEFPEIAGNEAIATLQTALQRPGSMAPDVAMELVKKLRFDAGKNFKAFDDPAKAALAKAQRGAADAVESLIERDLLRQGKGDLVPAFREARTLIAKSHDVESALLEGGNISAKALAKIGDKHPLSGELGLISKFAGTFEKSAQNPSQATGAGVSNLMALGSGGLGMGGAALTDSPYGAAAGLAPFLLPPAARNIALSNIYQRLLASPSYASGGGPVNSVVLNNLFTPAVAAGGIEGAIPQK